MLDFTTMVSGPTCTQVLGDLGADVVKVESPGGEPGRQTGSAQRESLSSYFAQLNPDKRSAVLDLHRPEGRDAALRLALRSDVVVENFRPGVADRLGIGWTALRARNPRLVYVAISGFGPDGPYADLPAYDHVLQGLTGLLPEQGGDGPPRMIQSVVVDKASGLAAASAGRISPPIPASRRYASASRISRRSTWSSRRRSATGRPPSSWSARGARAHPSGR